MVLTTDITMADSSITQQNYRSQLQHYLSLLIHSDDMSDFQWLAAQFKPDELVGLVMVHNDAGVITKTLVELQRT